ncbi:MAG: preprotein translocase subunit SecG [Pseudomonadota bacterium]
MSLFIFLTVVQAIVAAALIGVILMQRSEGGGLGIGGSPGGALGARGAADFLTRSTKWLAVAFVVLSIALAAIAVDTTGGDEITSTIDRNVAPASPLGETDPLGGDGAAPSEAGEPAEDDPLADQ